MEESKIKKSNKEFKPFWPIFIIFLAAIFIAAFVVQAVFDGGLEQDINSLGISRKHDVTKSPVSQFSTSTEASSSMEIKNK